LHAGAGGFLFANSPGEFAFLNPQCGFGFITRTVSPTPKHFPPNRSRDSAKSLAFRERQSHARLTLRGISTPHERSQRLTMRSTLLKISSTSWSTTGVRPSPAAMWWTWRTSCTAAHDS